MALSLHSVLVMAIFAASINSCFSLTEEKKAELKEKLKPILAECATEHGYTLEQLKEFKASKKSPDDSNKCFFACVYKKIGLLDGKGLYSEEVASEKIVEHAEESRLENAKQAAKACSAEKIDHIKDGEFIEDKDVMCYMACVMKMANTVKNGKLNYEAAMKQADLLLPDEIKEPAKAALTACRKIADQYKDICEAAFHITKCIYNHNPEIFFFP